MKKCGKKKLPTIADCNLRKHKSMIYQENTASIYQENTALICKKEASAAGAAKA